MIASSLHAIATRTWVPPTDRHTRLDELRTVTGGRTDLLTQEAGIILGVRVDGEHDARYIGRTAGGEMLLELAGVEANDERVQRWVAVDRDRREWRRCAQSLGAAGELTSGFRLGLPAALRSHEKSAFGLG
jgi:hypothetical protein